MIQKNTDSDDHRSPLLKVEQEKKGEGHDEHHLTGSLSDLIKIRKHLINLVILMYLWVAASFNLYMISFYMKYVGKNIFIATLTSCLGDIPLSIGGGFLYHFLGPKYAMPIFLSVAVMGSISLATWAQPKYELGNGLMSVLVLFTRSGIKCTFDSCYLANSTIFPAIFAGTAFGLCNIGAKLVTIFAPAMAEITPPTPMVIFSCFASIALVAALMI